MSSAEFREFPVNDPQTREMLWSSRHKDQQASWVALPRTLRTDSSGAELLVVELHKDSEFKSPAKNFAFWLQTIRAISLTATLTPGLAVLFLGIAKGWAWNSLHLALSLLGALLFQVAINLWNDVYDHLKLIDLPGTLGGSGVLQSGALDARFLNRVAWCCLILGILAGLPVLLAHPKLILLIGATAVMGVLGYSGPILNLKYRALGDLNVFLLCGPLLSVGFSLAIFSQFDLSVLLVGCYFGFAAMGILYANNLQDISVDQSRGARTLASVLGFVKARHGLWVLYVLAWASLLAVYVMGAFSIYVLLATLLVSPLAWQFSALALKASGPESGLLGGIRIKTAQLHLLMGLVLSVALFVEGLFRT